MNYVVAFLGILEGIYSWYHGTQWYSVNRRTWSHQPAAESGSKSTKPGGRLTVATLFLCTENDGLTIDVQEEIAEPESEDRLCYRLLNCTYHNVRNWRSYGTGPTIPRGGSFSCFDYRGTYDNIQILCSRVFFNTVE